MTSKLFLLFAALLFSSCTKKTDVALTSNSSTASAKILNLYCWSNYFSPSLIEAFEKKTGAKIQFSYFSSNEELLAKLQAGAKGYDVIVPTGYLIRALKELKLIQPLNAKLDAELKLLTGPAKNPWYDPNYEFTVPYSWGITGLAVNKALVKTKVDSWAWIFEHPEFKGKLTMLDDAPAVIGAALKYLGYKYNEESAESFTKVKQLLSKQKKNLKAYNSEPQSALINGEIAIAQFYSGDTLQIQKKNPNIDFVFPKEGGELFMDNLAIPTSAPSPDLAREFIRFTLDQARAYAQTQHLFYNPVVDLSTFAPAKEFIKNPVVFPSKPTLENFESLQDSPERLETIQKLWTELKSS